MWMHPKSWCRRLSEVVVDTASTTVVDAGFSVRHRLLDGSEIRGPLSVLWNSRFEVFPPVRPVAAGKGSRHFTGLWWSATTGLHVGFESWLERDNLMLLDFEPDVIAVASQPFWLSWPDGDGRRRHVPDYFARLADGSGVVVDVRADDRIERLDAAAFDATAQACRDVGWAYRRVGSVDPVFAANVRWLSGYRHPRCRAEATAVALMQVFDTPCQLAAGVVAVGDPIAVRPVVFHLLWTGALTTDLRSGLLHDAVVVSAAGSHR